MSTATKLAAYLALLLVLFAAAFALGRVVGPVGPAAAHSSVSAPAGTAHAGTPLSL